MTEENKNHTKEALYNLCLEFVDKRLQTIQNTISEIQNSLLSETKSSAGDKHETGRAMLQLEREKAGSQLAEIIKTKETLSKIDVNKTSKMVSLGSIVYTTQANYFISISVGKVSLKNNVFYAISPNTPIGKLLIGKSPKDVVAFRGQNFKILEVL